MMSSGGCLLALVGSSVDQVIVVAGRPRFLSAVTRMVCLTQNICRKMTIQFLSVFQIRISLITDPDQGFFLNADPDPDSGFCIPDHDPKSLSPKNKINEFFLGVFLAFSLLDS